METPWGHAQTITIAPGIISCDTSSHGGFYVDERHFDAMPPEYQAIRWPTGRSRDSGAWFEEDSAWTGVVLTWPELFLAYHRRELYSWQVMESREMHILEFSFRIAHHRNGQEEIVLSNTGDGSGETGVLRHLLQAFSAAFPQRPPIEVEWACNADRHVPGIFGGGATLFHQGEAHYFDTTRYLALAKDRIERRSRRFEQLPVGVERYYLRYVAFTPETLVTLTTKCDGTIAEAIEDAAEERARTKLAELTEYQDKNDWIAHYGRINWHMGIAFIAIALEPKLDIPVPPSEYDTIIVTA